MRIDTAWISAALLIAGALAAFPKPAAAETVYPWCAIYSERTVGATNCGFSTFAQCRATISGIGGMCVENPDYRPAERRAAPRRCPRHGARSSGGDANESRSRSRRRLMRLEPVAGGALRATDFTVRHLLGDLAAQLRRFAVTAHRGDVEPLVRLDQIDRHAGAGRMDHAEIEAGLGVGRVVVRRDDREMDHV